MFNYRFFSEHVDYSFNIFSTIVGIMMSKMVLTNRTFFGN
ncbi:hypothetical protein GAGA_3371 [Paraglaciecola agarilytica NO2]|uniref:Uncharacterized protein n=1 Tax=Paraglaciecola agarilytica NO2 TaxID=1125747 RepID=A0ABQ0IA83_9ALTE|nr:hypothetical protein GAGA_3371 [Paraglaciecola agarilytica NO2]